MKTEAIETMKNDLRISDVGKLATDSEKSKRLDIAGEQLHHYSARTYNVWDRTAAFQAEYAAHNSPAFHRFIDVLGIIYYRELQDCGIAFPTWQDMLTVAGETDLRLFLQFGASCYDQVAGFVLDQGAKARVLDFGVGCGRTARHFYRHLDRVEMHGCDVDEAPILWLRDNVPFIMPVHSNNSPPLPYDDNYFDAIYSISVFSHLNRPAFSAWLDELARIVRPKGRVIITTHGTHAMNILRERNNSLSINIQPKVFAATQSGLEMSGFTWMPQSTTSIDIDVSQYGISFITVPALQELIPSSLTLAHTAIGGIGNWQDLFVLEKK